MATSLARQLKKLSVPGRSEFREEQIGRRASLLFDSKEAATIGRSEIFTLGLSGFEELLDLDQAVFSEFADTLFSDNALSFQRSLVSRETAKNITATIERFLIRLSPYFLLKASLKCLEWLIRAYSIHRFDVDVLLECALPFYATRTFARVVQVLSLRDTRWAWLIPLGKAGAPLPRATFLQHCVSTSATLSFVCEMMPRALRLAGSELPGHGGRTLCSFYASSLVGVLDSVAEVGEEMVGRLLPHLFTGLRSDWLDYAMASLMVVTQLAARTQLNEKVVATICDVISKSSRVENGTESLACLAYLCQSQPLCKLTKKAVKALCRQDFFLPQLQRLAENHDVSMMIELLSSRLFSLAISHVTLSADDSVADMDVDELDNVYSDIFVKILGAVKLDQNTVGNLSRSVLNHYLKARKKITSDGRDQLHGVMRPMVKRLATRYPEEFDCALESHLKEISAQVEQEDAVTDEEEDSGTEAKGSKSDEMLCWTQEFLSLVLGGMKHGAVISGSRGMTLTLSLHHPKASVRRLGVLHLRSAMTEMHQDEEMDAKFYKDSLIARLEDDVPMVVQSVLDIGKDLLELVNPEDLVSPLCDLVSKQLDQTRLRNKEWQKICLLAVEILSSDEVLSSRPSFVDSVFHCLLPHFLLLPRTYKFSASIISTVAASALPANHPVFSLLTNLTSKQEWIHLRESHPTEAELVSLNVSLLSLLAEGWKSFKPADGNKLIGALASQYRQASRRNPLRVIFLCLMDSILRQLKTKQRLLLAGMTLETIFPELLELSRISVSDVPKPPKDSPSFIPSSLPLTLESALAAFVTRRRIRSEVLKFSGSALLFRVSAAVLSHLWFPLDDKRKWMKLTQFTESEERSIQITVLLSLFDVIAEGSFASGMAYLELFRELMNSFLNTFPGVESLLQFLVLLWTTRTGEPSPIQSFICLEHSTLRSPFSTSAQIRSLKTGQVILQSSDRENIFSQKSPVVPALFMLLSSPVPLLRQSALRCVQTIQDPCVTLAEDESYSKLCCVVCESATEVETDHSYVAQLLLASDLHQIWRCILHVVVDEETPIHVKASLLRTCKRVDCKEKLLMCLPFLRNLLERHRKKLPESLSVVEYKCLMLLLQVYTPASAPLLESSPDAKTVFIRALQCGHTPDMNELPSPQTCILQQLNREFFKALPTSELQQQVFSKLLDFTSAEGEEQNDIQAIKEVLVKISLKATLFKYELLKVLKPKPSPQATPAKRTRSHTRSAVAAVVDEKAWHRVIFVVELLQRRKHVHKAASLVSPLFSILNLALRLGEDDANFGMDYVLQLVLSCLMNICLSGEKASETLHEDQFNVEVVVECVRLSTNPQTHQHSLMLLNSVARLFPDRVLHKIMPIFTFMGASLLRMDDNYSLQVVSKTVETVIPALMDAEKPESESFELVLSIIRVFVDALPHIPQHRQLQVFEHLLTTLGSEGHLHTTLILLLEQSVLSGKKSAPRIVYAAPASQHFCLSLIHCFSPLEQTDALIKLLQYIRKLPEEKPEGQALSRFKKKAQPILFNLLTNSTKELNQFKVASLEMIIRVLASKAFAVKTLSLNSEEENELGSNYRQLLEETLSLISQTASSVDAHIHESTANFWKVFLSRQYDIIERLSALLSSRALIDIVSQLVENSNATVRRKAMDLFNSHLSSLKGKPSPEQVESLLEMMEKLISTVGDGPVHASVKPESIQNRQTALHGLTLLVKLLASDYPQDFKKVALICTDVIACKEETYQLEASAIQCLGQLCSAFGGHLLSYLPRFLPALMDCLLPTKELQPSSKELLQLSAASALLQVVQHYSKFLSPYLRRILKLVCHSSLCGDGENASKLSDKIKDIRSVIAKSVPVRVMYPAVADVYSPDSDGPSVVALMVVLGDSVSGMDRESATVYSSQLVSLFLNTFKYRTSHQEMALEEVAVVEDSIIASYITFMMKLSENAFRPVFLKLFEWATKKSSPRERSITFYRLSDRMAAKLMGLFALFAGPLLSNSASLLDTNNYSKADLPYFGEEKGGGSGSDSEMETSDSDGSLAVQKSRLLVHSILDCLNKTFLNASEGFLGKDIFQALIRPLVDQITNDFKRDEAAHIELVKVHLAPCIAQFAAAAKDRSQWKALNYQVLLKTRDTSAQVRLAALYVMQDLYLKMGEEFVTLLPETIPFIAELMEDDTLAVEMLCQSVIKTIEDLVGESIQSYLHS